MCLVPVSKSPNLVVNDFYVQKVVLVNLSDFTVYTPTQNLPLGKLWKLKGKVYSLRAQENRKKRKEKENG